MYQLIGPAVTRYEIRPGVDMVDLREAVLKNYAVKYGIYSECSHKLAPLAVDLASQGMPPALHGSGVTKFQGLKPTVHSQLPRVEFQLHPQVRGVIWLCLCTCVCACVCV